MSTPTSPLWAVPEELPQFVRLPPNYTCVMCGFALRLPVQTTCGHRMCEACVPRLFQNGRLENALCPVGEADCQLLDATKLTVDTSTRREIAQLPVYCRYRSRSCAETPKWQDLQTHLATCAYRRPEEIKLSRNTGTFQGYKKNKAFKQRGDPPNAGVFYNDFDALSDNETGHVITGHHGGKADLQTMHHTKEVRCCSEYQAYPGSCSDCGGYSSCSECRFPNQEGHIDEQKFAKSFQRKIHESTRQSKESLKTRPTQDELSENEVERVTRDLDSMPDDSPDHPFDKLRSIVYHEKLDDIDPPDLVSDDSSDILEISEDEHIGGYTFAVESKKIATDTNQSIRRSITDLKKRAQTENEHQSAYRENTEPQSHKYRVTVDNLADNSKGKRSTSTGSVKMEPFGAAAISHAKHVDEKTSNENERVDSGMERMGLVLRTAQEKLICKWAFEGWFNVQEEYPFPLPQNISTITGPRGTGSSTGHMTMLGKQPPQISRRIPKMFHRKSNFCGDTHDGFQMPPSIFTTLSDIAKEMGFDFPSLIESAENMGMNLPLPCMQCFEKRQGEGARELQHDMDASGQGGRCPVCGGKIQTLSEFGRMLGKMRKLMSEKDLVARDVYPDGNCAYAAIIDQLRVRGDFRYTVKTLRQAAVQFLRDNPNAEDDTPLALFLTHEETWDAYLARMSQDGEWGDHMTLNAICNALNMTLVIYGGYSGQAETRLVPLTAKHANTDTANPFPEIFLGHINESHYISLRPRQWKQRLSEDSVGNSAMETLYCHMVHIENIVKRLVQLQYITPAVPYSRVGHLPFSSEGNELRVDMVGSYPNKMLTRLAHVNNISPDIGIFFPTENVNKESKRQITTFLSPNDTRAVPIIDHARKKDLLINALEENIPGLLCLKPICPSLWAGETEYVNGEIILKTISISPNWKLGGHDFIAFRCDWPDCANEWFVRTRKVQMYSTTCLRTLYDSGCHIIPALERESMTDVMDICLSANIVEQGVYWCYSFATAERTICQRVLDNGQVQVFLIFRNLLDETVADYSIPMSVLKSVFYYACENVTLSDWISQPGHCLLLLLHKLAEGLEKRFIPHYFISQLNLLLGMEDTVMAKFLQEVHSIEAQFLEKLFFMADRLNVTATELGSFFDNIIDDVFMYSSHRNALRSFNEAIIPACSDILQDFVYQKNFNDAFVVLEDMREQTGLYSAEPCNVPDLIKTAMGTMAIGYKYCMSVFVDIQLNTEYSTDLCVGFETIALSEMFGPDIPSELGRKPVPSLYAIATGDLMFPSVFTTVLRQGSLHDAFISGLRFYLDTYAEIAGENLAIEGSMNSKSALYMLAGLYDTLWLSYLQQGRQEEFRPLLTRYTLIVEHSGVPYLYEYLASALRTLGEHDMAKDLEKRDTRGPQNMITTLMNALK
ncbi:uncharacterized protein LOC128234279 isoform X2 [Mya arenaria]|uniref:uncharacterized protein LOC128234279 isoform X2 n=1 Tax=Mya arenaria TaxID=6604 RepID=UPI0022E05333|nr:uncharacterized protein LOC128234279 isoform X2 [Mya arenaria]